MTTKYMWVEGPAKWFHIYPDTVDKKFGLNYSLNVYLSDAQISALKATGWRGEIKTDDGGNMAKFSRKHEQQFKDGMTVLGPPKVYLKETGEPFNKPLGHNSKVAVLLEIYDSKYGKGSRIREIAILDPIEYIPPMPTDIAPPV